MVRNITSTGIYSIPIHIVDEPTAGLDPAERVRFRTLLASLTRNRIVLLSTHIISDVEAVASRLVILQQGSVLAEVLREIPLPFPPDQPQDAEP